MGIYGFYDETALTSWVTPQKKRVIIRLLIRHSHLPNNQYRLSRLCRKTGLTTENYLRHDKKKEFTTNSNTMESTRRSNDEAGSSNKSFRRNSTLRKSLSSWFEKERVVGNGTVISTSIQHEDFTKIGKPSDPPCEPAHGKKTSKKCTIL